MTQIRGRHAGWLLAVLLTGQFMANVDVAVVNVATPSIHAGLRASGGALQLVVSGYILAYAMLLITGARLGDLRGYRRVFLGGLSLFTLARVRARPHRARADRRPPRPGRRRGLDGPPGPQRYPIDLLRLRAPAPSASTRWRSPAAPSSVKSWAACSSPPTCAAPVGARSS